MPASNDTRVRVEGRWKISATVRPLSSRHVRARSGAAFSSSRAIEQYAASSLRAESARRR